MAIGDFAEEYDVKFSEEKIHQREKPSPKVVICPNCSYVTTNVKMNCPKCGFQLIK
jgi:rubrerythrin